MYLSEVSPNEVLSISSTQIIVQYSIFFELNDVNVVFIANNTLTKDICSISCST